MAVFRLRKAYPEDIDALVRLEELCFPEEPWSRQMLLEEIENPRALFCVTEELSERHSADESAELRHEGNASADGEAEIKAYMITWIIEPFEAQIGSIAVHPGVRRHGFACRLMDVLFDTCRALSVDEISLEVRVSNSPAIALYERYGFKKNGIRKNYYQDGEDAYNMIRTGIV